VPQKREIEAAITAYNATDPEALLPPGAARLLVMMFPRSDVCQRSVADLMAVTSDRRRVVSRLLRLLTEAGFLSKEESLGRVANLYRLRLPPRVRR
jgi:hypothetical protein